MSAPQVVAVLSVDATTVTVDFDQAMLVSTALLDPASYEIDGGIFVTGVIRTSGTRMTLTTTTQIGGRQYNLAASAGLQSNTGPGFAFLNPLYAGRTFAGVAPPQTFVVTNLVAHSLLQGGGVELFWNNPAPTPGYVKIVRRQRNWIYDETDAGDIVFDGPATPTLLGTDPTVPKFTDVGLLEQTFYYYVVLVKHLLGDTYVITEDSRCRGLSTSNLASSDFINKRMIPRRYLEKDLEAPSSGELARYTTVLGGFTDLERSNINALSLLLDAEKAPWDYLIPMSRASGFEPEGASYDFDTPRRVLLQLRKLWSQKVSNPGIILAVRALVRWVTACQEFGVGSRIRLFGTYDDATPREEHTVLSGVSLYGKLTDPARVWADHLWQGGRLLDGMGNWIDIDDNTGGDVITYRPPETAGSPWFANLTANGISGTFSADLDNIRGLLVGQRVELASIAPGLEVGQVVEICAIVPVGTAGAGTIYFWNKLQFNFFAAAPSVMYWDVRHAESSMIGTTAGGSPAGTLDITVPTGTLNWQYGQWIGYQFKDSANVIHTVTASDATRIYYNVGDGVIPAGDVTLAVSFTGGVADLWYRVTNGFDPYLFDPRFDFELKGTRLDPFSYLGSAYPPLAGEFGPCILGLYVNRDVDGVRIADVVSRVASVSGNTITDPSANFVVNSLVGKYLLPNQNQFRLFQITANTATTITASGSLEAFARAAQAYAVLTPRNANRYTRLLKRIVEFMPECMDPVILFL